MDVLALAIAVAFFMLLASIFTYLYIVFMQKSVNVSKRIGSMYVKKAIIKKEVSFWSDLKASYFLTLARKGSNTFGHIIPRKEELTLLAERAGLPVTGPEFLFLSFGFAGIMSSFFFILTFDMVRTVGVGIISLLICVVYIRSAAERRRKLFDAQLNDAVIMISNALKAGFTFQQAMDVVSKDLGDPISTEFHHALNEIRLGISLEDALNGICKRINSDDFELVTTAVIIQRQVGGNLASILDIIASTIRERIKIKLEVKSLTAEGIMTGWVLAFMPAFIAAAMLFMNPHHFDPFIASKYGKFVIAGCVVSELIGGFIIKRLVDIKV